MHSPMYARAHLRRARRGIAPWPSAHPAIMPHEIPHSSAVRSITCGPHVMYTMVIRMQHAWRYSSTPPASRRWRYDDETGNAIEKPAAV